MSELRVTTDSTCGTLTARRYVDDILTPYPCYQVAQVPFMNRLHRPHTARLSQQCLRYDTWPARSRVRQ
ncbi:hypothetical protein TNCV_1265531 [Trichonephila clavipes]|nr:hypothetical protein TNCV_1265531 [Trichonephila clavipes]